MALALKDAANLSDWMYAWRPALAPSIAAIAAQVALSIEGVERFIQQVIEFIVDRILVPMHRNIKSTSRTMAWGVLLWWFGPSALVFIASIFAFGAACLSRRRT